MIPNPWVGLVLTLATFRLVRLIGWDDFPPVVRIRDWATGKSARRSPTESTEMIVRYRRPTLEHFIGCPFCQGFWVGVVVYAVWLAVGHPGDVATHGWVFYPLMPFALNAVVGLMARNLDP